MEKATTPSEVGKTEAQLRENLGVDPHPDAEFGGPEERKKIEKKLLLKLDLRMSILISELLQLTRRSVD